MAGVLSNVSGLSQTRAPQVFRQKPDGRRHPPGYAASRSTRHGLAQKLPSKSIYQKLNSNAPSSKAWSPRLHIVDSWVSRRISKHASIFLVTFTWSGDPSSKRFNREAPRYIFKLEAAKALVEAEVQKRLAPLEPWWNRTLKNCGW